MPNVFRAISDKSLVSVRRARHSQSTSPLLVSDDGSTFQPIRLDPFSSTPAIELSPTGDGANALPLIVTRDLVTALETCSAGSRRPGPSDASSGTRSTAHPSLAAQRRGVAYEGFKTVLKTVNEGAAMFPPLKSAAAALLSILGTVDLAVSNKREFDNMSHKLNAILKILNQYEQHGRLNTLEPHIEKLSKKIISYAEQIARLREHSIIKLMAQGTKDSQLIVKIFRDVGILLDAFQTDIALKTDVNVELILQAQKNDIIHRIHGYLKYADRASYTTRYGGEDYEPHGCMTGTRENILAELESWALDDMAPKVYWLSGMAGTGKSSIAHSLCEILDEKGILGASFFCSRSDSVLRDPSRVVPTIASMLARSSPPIRSDLCQVLDNDPDSGSLNSLSTQFDLLISGPITSAIPENIKTYKIVVIDAIDECSYQLKAESLINTICDGVVKIPLKFFISSRPEEWVKKSFRPYAHVAQRLKTFPLHNVAEQDVRGDIETFLRSTLSTIAQGFQDSSDWPSEEELQTLLDRSGRLFIYAATAVRYIRASRGKYKQRMTAMMRPGSTSPLQTGLIDSFYKLIMDEAFSNLEPEEVFARREVLTTVVFLQTPLSINGIASLLVIPEHDIKGDLSPFCSVIRVPSSMNDSVSIFHMSFRDFILNPARSKTHQIDASEGHYILSNKCLECLNMSLRRNRCNLAEDTIGSRSHVIEDLSVVPVALQYSCLYWAYHLDKVLANPPADAVRTLSLLSEFADKHILHWFECLSIMGTLESGIESLRKAKDAVSMYSETHPEFKCIVLLFEDACRCLQIGFEAMQLHCLNVYHSALTWIPRQSIMRRHYGASLCVPEVLGLSDSWEPLEHVMHHSRGVWSVALSPDGSRVVSGSLKTIRVWSMATGDMECLLEGHSNWVRSVAFSPNGSRLVTGSEDRTVRIWSVVDWKTVHVLEGHSDFVTSVNFSPDGTYVVSGSDDKHVWVWVADTGETKCILKGHLAEVWSVTFSHNGSHLASGSKDRTIRIWDADTGKAVRILEGHLGPVWAVAFSSNGGDLVSGSADKTVRIWHRDTGETVRILRGHLDWVKSVAFSTDGCHVVSGSDDHTIRVWHVATGKMEHILKGHLNWVNSVAFSHDGSRVVSGSTDWTTRTWIMEAQHVLEDQSYNIAVSSVIDNHTHYIWNTLLDTTRMKPYAMPPDHSYDLYCVSFSPDGSHIVSASQDTVQIWRTNTAEIVHVLRGHSNKVMCAAFSPSGSRVVSGSADHTIHIWNSLTAETELVLEGHLWSVRCVAFSPSGGHVVSGGEDCTVRIWNATTGEGCVLQGHSGTVWSVAFSHDSSRVVSGSDDGTVCIWTAATAQMERMLHDLGWVTCVAFSHDDHYVVSRELLAGTIRIWDMTAGELTESPGSCQLPGGSRVNALNRGAFYILDPVNHEAPSQVSLSSDFKWLLWGSPMQDCWLAAENRDRAVDFSGSKVCIAYSGGGVAILDLATAC